MLVVLRRGRAAAAEPSEVKPLAVEAGGEVDEPPQRRALLQPTPLGCTVLDRVPGERTLELEDRPARAQRLSVRDESAGAVQQWLC